MFLFSLAALFFVTGCKKIVEHVPSQQSKEMDNVAIPILTDEKDAFYYEVKVKVGHPAESCQGCVYINGKLYHVDCQGYGNYCNPGGTIRVEREGKNPVYHAITLNAYDFTDLDTFFMPDRSLLILNNEEKIWINIPEQMMVRDVIRGNFTIENITYDDHPLFVNE